MTDFISTTDPEDTLEGVELILPKGTAYNAVDGKIAESSPLISGAEIAVQAGSPAETIVSATDQTNNAKKISTYVWDASAVQLQVAGGSAKVGSSYQSTINWTYQLVLLAKH